MQMWSVSDICARFIIGGEHSRRGNITCYLCDYDNYISIRIREHDILYTEHTSKVIKEYALSSLNIVLTRARDQVHAYDSLGPYYLYDSHVRLLAAAL